MEREGSQYISGACRDFKKSLVHSWGALIHVCHPPSPLSWSTRVPAC